MEHSSVVRVLAKHVWGPGYDSTLHKTEWVFIIFLCFIWDIDCLPDSVGTKIHGYVYTGIISMCWPWHHVCHRKLHKDEVRSNSYTKWSPCILAQLVANLASYSIIEPQLLFIPKTRVILLQNQDVLSLQYYASAVYHKTVNNLLKCKLCHSPSLLYAICCTLKKIHYHVLF